MGVYRPLRPRGPLDVSKEIEGPALETLVLQDLRAYIEQQHLGGRTTRLENGVRFCLGTLGKPLNRVAKAQILQFSQSKVLMSDW